MSGLLLAFAMICGGVLLVYYLYSMVEGEYPVTYWLGWAVIVGGILLMVGIARPGRASYLFWSSALAIVLALSFLLGRIDEEYLPSGWISYGILICNVIILVAGALVGSSVLAAALAALGAALLSAGFWLRASDRDYYDAAFSASGITLIIALLVGLRMVRSPLEQLNQVEIPGLNQAIEAAQSRLASYDGALEQAQQYRSRISTEFGTNDAAYLAVVDESLRLAAEHYDKAQQSVVSVGAPLGHVSSYNDQIARDIAARTEQASLAATEGRRALDRLKSVQTLYETLSSEWIKEYLWFEVDGYWTSEENDYPSYNVCYYGERMSTRDNANGEGRIKETIVSDPADRGVGGVVGGDTAGVDWKYFTVADYQELVNQGVVRASDSAIDTDEEAGYYLCGRRPQLGQHGALGEPPVVIEKAYGSLTREVGDEGASFVGDRRYGTWCTAPPGGQATPIPAGQTPPADAQWCWYQRPGESTEYYWERRGSFGSYIYIRSHRRCVYCTPQATWRGDSLVPDSVMARTNGTEGSSVRGPADQGGGPGTGK